MFREYPFLEEEDLLQALRYAAASVDEELVDLNRVASSGSCSTKAWRRGR